MAIMTRTVANYFEHNDNDSFGWLTDEARMFEKRVGEPIHYQKANIARWKIIEFLDDLTIYYGRNGALSWSVRLNREKEWIQKKESQNVAV